MEKDIGSSPLGAENERNFEGEDPSGHGETPETEVCNSGVEEDVEKMLEWAFPITIGPGLSNLGNTCFLNSVLQCLTYTAPLGQFLQRGQHKSSCQNTEFCAMCALEMHVKEALRSDTSMISPTFLVKNLRHISTTFQSYRQEDAHEYMRYFIEALHKSFAAKSSDPGENNPIYKIFGGRLRSQVRCAECGHCSDTVEPFLDLSLEIVRADSLPKALARFTAVEVLDSENRYQCEKCSTKVRALKRFTIESAPNVLTVQFKRFSCFGDIGDKIDKKVEFRKTLDIKPFMSNGQHGFKYDLYAVLVHSGHSTYSGHYYCFVRTSPETWYLLDDSHVRQVTEQEVFEQKAYILFYVKSLNPECESIRKPPAAARMTSPRFHTLAMSPLINTPCKPSPSPAALTEYGASKSPNGTFSLEHPHRDSFEVPKQLTVNESSSSNGDSKEVKENNLPKSLSKDEMEMKEHNLQNGICQNVRLEQSGCEKVRQIPYEKKDVVKNKGKENAQNVKNWESPYQRSYVKLLQAMPSHRRALLEKALPVSREQLGSESRDPVCKKLHERLDDEWEYDCGKVNKTRRGASGGRLTACSTDG